MPFLQPSAAERLGFLLFMTFLYHLSACLELSITGPEDISIFTKSSFIRGYNSSTRITQRLADKLRARCLLGYQMSEEEQEREIEKLPECRGTIPALTHWLPTRNLCSAVRGHIKCRTPQARPITLALFLLPRVVFHSDSSQQAETVPSPEQRRWR